ncbi:MAG: glycogen/starch/alpha-glucan phosphorylase, partial [Nitrospinota bacterium]
MAHSVNEKNPESEFPSKRSLRKRTEYHLKKTLGLGLKGVRSIEDAVTQKLYLHIYKALSLGLRDRIMDNWIATNHEYEQKQVKKLYYFSAEYLTGRFMGNNLVNLMVHDEVKEFLTSVGLNFNEVEDQEMDAGLGNGGLGRLAACFLDSIAALELPGHGYGLRYDYGIFRQEIRDGYQVEFPDQWLQHGNPWEMQHEEDSVVVKFGGKLKRRDFFENKEKTTLTKYEGIAAVPYDTPVIGYNTKTVNTLRLWSTSMPDYEQFDIGAFDRGEYEDALGDVISHDSLTMVSILYPNDNHDSGKRLRLKQQYILVSASVQDIVR